MFKLLLNLYWMIVLFIPFELKSNEPAEVEYITGPFEFGSKIWHVLFDNKPVALLQKQKAADGSLYYILEKFEDPKDPHSAVSYYLKRVQDKIYLLYKEDIHAEQPPPPLINMGIPWDTAVKIEKVNLLHKVNAMGMRNTSKWVMENITKHRNIYFYTPEFIEAAKKLKLLPKNYKPPPLLPKDEVELERYLSTKVTPKLIDPQLLGEEDPGMEIKSKDK